MYHSPSIFFQDFLFISSFPWSDYCAVGVISFPFLQCSSVVLTVFPESVGL